MSTVLGIDYASVDGDPPPDVKKLYAAGVRFAYLRKSYIAYDAAHQAFVLLPDKTYARDIQAFRDAGIVVGAYGFWSFHKNAPSAAAQVANFVHAAGDIKEFVDLPPCSDVEFPGNGVADTGRTQAECYAFALELVDEIKKQLGVNPIIYTSHVEWCDTNGLGGPKDLGGRDCPLWIKIPYRLAADHALDQVAPREPHYGADPTDRADLFRVPPPWQHDGWWIRQFQGDVRGIDGVVQADADDFRYLDCNQPSYSSDPRAAWVARKLHCIVSDIPHVLVLFQAKFGLKSDCVIGPKTFAALAWQR